MTFAGTPTATEYGSMLLVTTEFAPITAPSPMVTPDKTHTWLPIQTLLPIRIPPLECSVLWVGGSDKSSKSVLPCELSLITIFVPVSRWSPIIISFIAVI